MHTCIYIYIKYVQGTGGTTERARLRNRPTLPGPEQRSQRTGPAQTGPAEAWNGTAQLDAEWQHIWTGLDPSGPDWIEPHRTGPDWTEQDPTELGRTDEIGCCLEGNGRVLCR